MTSHIKRLFKTQDGLCFYCREPMILNGKKNHPRLATVDHKVPLTHDGQNAFENKVAACVECNQLKRPLHYQVFIAMLRTGNRSLIQKKRDEMLKLVQRKVENGVFVNRARQDDWYNPRPDTYWPGGHSDPSNISRATLADVWPKDGRVA